MIAGMLRTRASVRLLGSSLDVFALAVLILVDTEHVALTSYYSVASSAF